MGEFSFMEIKLDSKVAAVASVVAVAGGALLMKVGSDLQEEVLSHLNDDNRRNELQYADEYLSDEVIGYLRQPSFTPEDRLVLSQRYNFNWNSEIAPMEVNDIWVRFRNDPEVRPDPKFVREKIKGYTLYEEDVDLAEEIMTLRDSLPDENNTNVNYQTIAGFYQLQTKLRDRVKDCWNQSYLRSKDLVAYAVSISGLVLVLGGLAAFLIPRREPRDYLTDNPRMF